MPQSNVAPCPPRLWVQQLLQIHPQPGSAVPGVSRVESPCAAEPRRRGR